MPAVERVEFGRAGRRADALLGFEVESPRSGAASEAFAVRVGGWALAPGGAPESIVVGVKGRILGGTKATLPSPDIAERFPGVPGAGQCRWSLVLNTLDLPEEFAATIRGVFPGDVKARLAEVRGRRRPLAPRRAPTLGPLLVTSLGRTGTTFLMRLLAEHPEVVAYRNYPFEVRGGKYWAHVFRTLAAPGDPAKRTGHVAQFTEDGPVVSGNPFLTTAFQSWPEVDAWQGGAYVDDLADFATRSIDGWYGAAAAAQGDAGARFFAEKGFADDTPHLFRLLYPEVREVFLVRDPRDMVTSMLAYNRRKGTGDFGRDRHDSDLAWMRGIRRGVDLLRNEWQARREQAVLVRYEDLVADPATVLAATIGPLGLDTAPATIAAVLERAAVSLPQFDTHATSASTGASLGRWRADLDPAFADEVAKEFAELVAFFNYPE